MCGGLILVLGYSWYKQNYTKNPYPNVNGQPVTKGSKPLLGIVTTALADVPQGIKAYNAIAKALGNKVVDDTGTVALDYDDQGNAILDGSGSSGIDYTTALDYDENGFPIWDSSQDFTTLIDDDFATFDPNALDPFGTDAGTSPFQTEG